MPTERPAARSFRDLVVWQKAHEFVLGVYRLTESFPEREKYGLAHQLRRAAVSIPANIAEGFGKRSPAEKARFLNIAEGSVEESRYYLILAHDLGYGQTESMTLWRRSLPAESGYVWRTRVQRVHKTVMNGDADRHRA